MAFVKLPLSPGTLERWRVEATAEQVGGRGLDRNNLSVTEYIMKRMWAVLGVVFLTVGMGQTRGAEIVANAGTGIDVASALDATFGYRFTVGNNPIQITALGMFDDNQDGFTYTHQIALWQATPTATNLLASVTVPAESPAQGQFYYVSLLSPVSLEANTTYALGVTYAAGPGTDRIRQASGANRAIFSSDFTGTPASFLRVDNPAGTPTYPIGGYSFGSDTYIGANAQYNVVPEPSVVVLLLGGGLLLLWRLRRKRAR
jgi:hypothetical protein